MYHILTKNTNAAGQRAVLRGNIESRDEARQFARENDGTVKTDAELTQMIGDGKIAVPSTPTPKETEVTTSTAPATSNETTQSQDGAAGTTPTTEDNTGNTASAATSIEGAAEQVAAEQAKRTTVGKKAKAEPKRVKTAPEVLEDARTDMKTWAEQVRQGKLSKVDFVRNVALWNGKKLQRSDAILLTAEMQLGISPATVSTQFQFARSERMNEYKQNADKRAAEAAEREAKQAAAKAEKDAAKAKREAEKAAKEKAKADAKAQREQEKAAKEAAAKAEADRKAAEAAANAGKETAATQHA